MDEHITYVGLDVHKETISVALAIGGRRGEVREHGQISNTPAALTRLLSKLSQPGAVLRFCYEAGPCGYGIQRQLAAAGHDCVVVAPSLIPRKPGDRIKTDRRDAVNLAKLHRAGELTPVWIPDLAHEAMRDLVRARLAAVRSLRQARQQLVRISVASRIPLQSSRLDADASPLAGWATIRAARPPHRPGRLYVNDRSRNGPS